MLYKIRGQKNIPDIALSYNFHTLSRVKEDIIRNHFNTNDGARVEWNAEILLRIRPCKFIENVIHKFLIHAYGYKIPYVYFPINIPVIHIIHLVPI